MSNQASANALSVVDFQPVEKRPMAGSRFVHMGMGSLAARQEVAASSIVRSGRSTLLSNPELKV